jgi:hypothetical protein
MKSRAASSHCRPSITAGPTAPPPIAYTQRRAAEGKHESDRAATNGEQATGQSPEGQAAHGDVPYGNHTLRDPRAHGDGIDAHANMNQGPPTDRGR